MFGLVDGGRLCEEEEVKCWDECRTAELSSSHPSKLHPAVLTLPKHSFHSLLSLLLCLQYPREITRVSQLVCSEGELLQSAGMQKCHYHHRCVFRLCVEEKSHSQYVLDECVMERQEQHLQCSAEQRSWEDEDVEERRVQCKSSGSVIFII